MEVRDGEVNVGVEITEEIKDHGVRGLGGKRSRQKGGQYSRES